MELRDAHACPVVSVSFVVPVWNEEAAIELFLDSIRQVFDGNASVCVEIIFVNDGSTDDTLHKLLQHQQQDDRVKIIDLSRNFGKEAALTAGLQAAIGRVVIPIDVDLQDPPELVCEMLALWRDGYDVVLGRRINRNSDTFAKRTLAKCFYRVHNIISEPIIPENVGDFRLMDRVVVDVIKEFPETRRFMKGLFAWAGFRTTVVDYERPSRSAGKSKFNGWRLWNFALEGLTSFGTAPLRIWTYIGCTVAFFSFLYGLYIAVRVLVIGVDMPGYASVFVAVTFLGGLQLVGIGVIGEYLGRTYIESKRRPIFIVRRIYDASK